MIILLYTQFPEFHKVLSDALTAFKFASAIGNVWSICLGVYICIASLYCVSDTIVA